jgi:SpoVK/Ycf46/Vps4 family AAA+-type ATPase
LSKAIAKQWGLPLISLNMSRVFSPRVGESEANFLKAIKTIESLSPCILFIDEIEKGFAGSQSSTFSDAGTTARVIGNFLTWYQDNTYPIFIIATCNSIQYLPPELVSRFDDKFFVNIPSCRERMSIFDICLRRYKRDWKTLNISPTTLAEKSILLTGREIDQVVKAGIVEAFYEQRQKNKGKKPDAKDLVTVNLRQEHLEKVLFSKIPIIKTMEDDIKYLVQWVGWDEDKKDGIRANYANVREEDEKDDINVMLNEVLKSKEDYVKRFHDRSGK